MNGDESVTWPRRRLPPWVDPPHGPLELKSAVEIVAEAKSQRGGGLRLSALDWRRPTEEAPMDWNEIAFVVTLAALVVGLYFLLRGRHKGNGSSSSPTRGGRGGGGSTTDDDRRVR